VPFFLRGGAALMSGRGEQLDALPPIVGQWLVLLVPTHDVADKTRQLYGALDSGDFSSGVATRQAAERLRRRQALEPDACVNGFQRAAREVFPGLARTWADAEQRCERTFHLSGAGPALFAFAKDRADAQKQVKQVGPGALSVRTVKHARASTNAIRYA
jgi:4-diphosphocytidyl-2-C-methyl-D-erythritol kinase